MPNLERARNAFLSGEAFLHVCRVLTAAIQAGDTKVLSLVLATNSAFALEMFLKSLLMVESGLTRRGHDILELFEALKPETKRELIEAHDQFVTENPAFAEAANRNNLPTGLRSLLMLGRDAFVKFRYAHERIPSETVWGLNGFIKCVRDRLIVLQPDWADLL